MGRRGLAVLACLTGLASVAPAGASMLDGPSPLWCASLLIQKCLPAGDCTSARPVEQNVPQFLRVDWGSKEISGTRPDGSRLLTRFGRSDDNERAYLHGILNNRTWSGVIHGRTGEMIATWPGERGGFVLFGACMPAP